MSESQDVYDQTNHWIFLFEKDLLKLLNNKSSVKQATFMMYFPVELSD